MKDLSNKKPVEVEGVLEAFFETGTEGIVWSVVKGGDFKYENLFTLENGDLLTVFNDASKKDVLWQGEVKLEYENKKRPHPLNPEYKKQEVFGRWVNGLQENADPEKWAQMFLDEKPAKLIKNNPKI